MTSVIDEFDLEENTHEGILAHCGKTIAAFKEKGYHVLPLLIVRAHRHEGDGRVSEEVQVWAQLTRDDLIAVLHDTIDYLVEQVPAEVIEA